MILIDIMKYNCGVIYKKRRKKRKEKNQNNYTQIERKKERTTQNITFPTSNK
jgi:hypothetical protein